MIFSSFSVRDNKYRAEQQLFSLQVLQRRVLNTLSNGIFTRKNLDAIKGG